MLLFVLQVFNCYNVDHKLALSYILSQPHKLVLETLKKLINSSGHNYKKLTVGAF